MVLIIYTKFMFAEKIFVNNFFENFCLMFCKFGDEVYVGFLYFSS